MYIHTHSVAIVMVPITTRPARPMEGHQEKESCGARKGETASGCLFFEGSLCHLESGILLNNHEQVGKWEGGKTEGENPFWSPDRIVRKDTCRTNACILLFKVRKVIYWECEMNDIHYF